ncbi:hypothetical protein D9756_002762 [Leucocoprinus leucothites]|uniref:WD40 repeat-like protein n=1 Tax=Leucocoprinus leucothites TaxID=201217 RepID=A0A8H5GBQ8_9AGAR|nr:hypothetical protein D9756_002762 [Leucoagaricus leucothites]
MSAKIFDATTHDVVYHGEEPTGVECCSPSHSSRKILLGYSDGTIRMWVYHRQTQVSPVINPVTDSFPKLLDRGVVPVFSPCGKTLAVSYKDEIKLLDTTTGEPINLSHPIQTRGDVLAFSGDGRYIASLTTHRNHSELPVANIWDTNTGMNRRHLVITDAVKEGDFDLFFVSSNNQLVLCSSVEEGEEERYVMRIWGDDVLDEPCTTVTLPRPKRCNTDSVAPSLVLSPDTLTALVDEHTTADTILHCHRRSSIEEQFTPHALFDAVALGPKITWWSDMAAFSPSGQLFASAGLVKTHTGLSCQLRAWETKTWTEIAGPFEGGEVLRWVSPSDNRPTFLSLSPDDRLIRFVSPRDGAIWVWDIHTGRKVAGPWRRYDLKRTSLIAMSPDGDKLASAYSGYGSPSVRLWDTHGLHSGKAQKPVGGIGDFGDLSLIRDGWVKEEGSDSLLFWVPAEHRDRLWWPRNIAVVGVTPTKLDFSRFKYRRGWEECIDKDYTTPP